MIEPDTISIEQLFEEEIIAITEYAVALKEQQAEFEAWSEDWEEYELELTKMKHVVEYLQDRLDGKFDYDPESS
jgi:predicted  nucleic acid-binding Zn-ribbon protein